MTEIVIAVAGKVSEYLVASIGRKLGYLFCYRSHTDELRNNVQKLGKARDDIEISVDEAMRRGYEIRHIVQDWLNQVDEITKEAEELMMKDENNKISRFSLKSRYQLGREAYKKARVIVRIQQAGDFPDGVSYGRPPRTATFKEYESFLSRASTLNKIMDALRDDKTKIIGVWGMGGMGKTTLLKQVAELAKQQNLFTTQVYVQVSWTREPENFQQGILDIQQQIGGMLGLEFKNEAQSTKAAQLMKRLKKEKILIVLDDIWKAVNLEEVGIPYCKDDDQKDCKILLASRDENLLLQDMCAQECFPVQQLPPEAAWQLFKMTAGDSVENDHDLRIIAMMLVKRCHGLPIAIVTIAKALKGQNRDVWHIALEELNWSAAGVEETVYACLELSYNHLKSSALKSLFLLCGMLSYGDIWMDDLLSYAMGLDSFDRIKSLEEARNELIALLTDLKTSSLLLEGDYRCYFGRGGLRLLFVDDDNKCVRMHDVVRDVARNIASKDPHRFVVREDNWSEIDESKYISLYCKAVHELPQRLVCPKLQFLLLRSNLNINIPNTFFEGMNQLKVLDLSRMDFGTLPSTLQFLANLRTLCLDWCNKLRDIAGIGELKKLQVLSMVSSHIEQLPKEMRQLTDLRLLNLNDCEVLEVIPQNILSKLSGLECLFMRSSFYEWEAAGVSGGESNNACLSELNHLDHLRTIEIEIPNVEMVPKEDKFFQNLTSFAIFIGNFNSLEKSYERSKTLRLKGGDGSLLLRNGMRKLLEKIEELKLSNLNRSFISNNEKNDSTRGLFSPPVPVSFHNLKCLSISYCAGNVISIPIEDGVLFGEQVTLPALEHLCIDKLDNVKTLWQNQLAVHSFCKLERLQIRSCESLEQVFDTEGVSSYGSYDVAVHHPLRESGLYYQGPGFLTLQNLHSVEVISCPYLKYVFPASVAKGLLQLELLKIVSCGVEEIVANENGDGAQSMVLFPRLASLTLTDLGELRCFYSGTHASGWPLLKNLEVKDCNNLEILASQVDVNSISESLLLVETFPFPALEVLEIFHMENMEKIWQDQLPMKSFGKLKEIRLSHCRNLLSVFPTSVIQGLEQLEIDSCEMKEIFAEEDGLEKPKRFIFPKLTNLTLKNLKALQSFYPGNYISEWPLLKKLEICNCGNIDILFQEIGSEGSIDNQVQQPFFLITKSAFPKLEVLEITQMENMNKIWHGQLSTMESFGNLKHIRISHCRNLSTVFPTSANLSLLQLETLELDSCGTEEILVKDDGIEAPLSNIFPKLSCLILKNLKELKCFNSRKHISKWPSLKKLEIQNCDKIEILFQDMSLESNLDNHVQRPFFSVEKLAFSKLEVVEITQMENMKKIWHGQLSKVESFGNIKHIRISHCINLSTVFPISANLSLLQLETLELDSCGTEEVLVMDDGIEAPLSNIFPKLSCLILKNLKELKCFNSRKHISKWPSLKKLEIQNCDKIEILFQEMGLEANLDNQVQRPFFSSEKVAFPTLEELHISNLDNVERIWHNEFITDSFGKLKRLSVQSCQRLKNIIPTIMLKRLPSLQILKIVDCDSVEEVFNMKDINSEESHDIPALQLRELCLDNLKNLKYVWNEAPEGLLTYQNLNRVKVSHCPSLEIPFPGYVVRSLLQVKDVDMNSCGMEEIVAREDVAKVVSMFLFPEETSLQNSSLHKLKCFYLGLHTLEWPKLKTLDVESYERLEKLACELVKDVKLPIFLCDKVTFPNLESLSLSLKLKEIQDLHVLFGALSNLKNLTVENCPFLLSLFSPRFLQCLNNLKKLTVKKCDLLEEVFDCNGLGHGDAENVEMLSKLEDMSLIDLPKLRYICNNSPPKVLCFKNLKLLQVKQCNSLTYLFTPSMLSGLVQLQDLWIEHCPAVKEIFTVEGRDTDNWHREVSCFKNLKDLQVKECESLMYLFSYSVALGLEQLQDLCIELCIKMEKIIMEDGDVDNRPQEVSSFKNLKSVRVKQCDSLMCLFPSSLASGLVQLQGLCIEDCPTMKEIITADGRDFDNQSQQVSSFQSLESVQVKRCGVLTYLFPSSMALGLVQLQELSIEHCFEMKVIVKEDWNKNNKPQQVSCFQSLKIMQVKQCHSLMHLFPSSIALALVQLQDLRIEHCDAMKEIIREDKDIDNRHPIVSCLKNLKFVQVKECNNLMYLFSSYFAVPLVQLQDLCIEHCSMMKEIVTAKEGVTDEIVFPQLTRVSLLKIPRLTSFYGFYPSQNLKKIYTGDSNSAPMVLFDEKVAFPKMELLHVSGLNNVKKIWQNKLLADSFSKLKEMKVENCNELQNISTSNVLNWLPSLESLRIASCGKLKEVFDLEVENVGEHVTVNQLSQLVLENVHNLKHICHKVLGRKLCVQNLKFLQVHECHSMKNLFSLYTELKAEGEIIREEEVIDKIEFSELTSLALKCLPSLENFYPGSHTLRRVGPQDHDILITVLFNEKVSFPSLKSLNISGLDSIKKIWHNKLIENSFDKHKQVKVENCNELQNGSPSNVLKQLRSLQFLRIASCANLKEVFDLEGVGHIQEDVTATELNHLVLQDLPRLKYIWNKDPYGILTFQKMDLVEVMGCHGLKSHFPVGGSVRDLPQLEKQLIRSRRTPAFGEKDEGEGFVFPEVTYDQPLSLRKIKGKEVVKAGNDVSEISKNMPSGSSG